MSTVFPSFSRPRTIAVTWVAAVLAPFAWLSALHLMSSLIDDECGMGSRVLLWGNAIACIVLAAAPAAALLAPWRRSMDPKTSVGLRAPLILDLAMAGSLTLALVMLATSVPILFLNACRP